MPTSNTMLRPRLPRRKSGASGWANNTRAKVGPTSDSERQPWRRYSVGGGKWLLRSSTSRLRLAKAMMSSSQVQPAFAVVVRFLAQGRRQARQQLLGADAPGPLLATHQLGQGEGAAPPLQLLAPFVVEPAALVEHEEHLERSVAEQYVRRLLPGRGEILAAVGDVQPLQQALADPTLALPFAGIGQERIGLLGLDGKQAEVV